MPALLPELNADAKWQRIIKDQRPHPAHTALGDEIAAQLNANPAAFREIWDGDFKYSK